MARLPNAKCSRAGSLAIQKHLRAVPVSAATTGSALHSWFGEGRRAETPSLCFRNWRIETQGLLPECATGCTAEKQVASTQVSDLHNRRLEVQKRHAPADVAAVSLSCGSWEGFAHGYAERSTAAAPRHWRKIETGRTRGVRCLRLLSALCLTRAIPFRHAPL